MAEIYWENDMSPENLTRRAQNLRGDGLLAMASLLERRAQWLRENYSTQDEPKPDVSIQKSHGSHPSRETNGGSC